MEWFEVDAHDSAGAAAAAEIAAAAFAALLLSAHLAAPHVDPSWQPVSLYALQTHGWIMTAAFASLGLSTVALVVALRPHVRGWPGRVARGLLLVGAAGCILAALFPMDPMESASPASRSDQLHSLGAALGDGLTLGAAVATWHLVRHIPQWQTAWSRLVPAAVLVWIAQLWLTGVLAMTMPANGNTLGPDVPMGWPNRLLLVAGAWWIAMAARCARQREPVLATDPYRPSGAPPRDVTRDLRRRPVVSASPLPPPPPATTPRPRHRNTG